MDQKKKILVVLLVFFVLLWAVGSWPAWKSFKGFGSLAGVAGYCLFSLSLVFSSRYKRLEDWFGGLDQLYHLHRRLGIWGFALIVAHPWIEALKWLPDRLDKFFLFTLPLHGRFSVNLGVYAYWLMIVILGVTLLRLLSYDRWKRLHQGMILVFALASFHMVLSQHRIGSEFSQGLLWIPLLLGFWAIIYKQFLIQSVPCAVAGVEKLNDNVIELTIEVEGAPIAFMPGQYGFFSFENPDLTRESHPFTMIGLKDPKRFLILIKARGDFTDRLFQYIQRGDRCFFEGPYGRFDYRGTEESQIWIAGGVGIVPFIAWIRALQNQGLAVGNVDLYYCIHRPQDAVFREEFLQFSRENPSFRLFVQCAEEGNRLGMAKLLDQSGGVAHKKILMCGPIRLTGSLQREFQAQGVLEKDIYFENFEFF